MWLLVALPAFALDWYLETPDRADREEASTVEEIAVEAGFDARVVRRFTEGEGWRYVARIDGFADSASARIAARQLAEATGVALVVVELDGDKATRLEDVPSSATIREPEPEEEDASEELVEVAAAHGVAPELLAQVQSGPVRFEYRRTLPDGRVLQHLWAAQGGRIYVEVGGGVTSRRLRIAGDRAELSVEGAAFSRQSGKLSRSVADSLGPSKVIPVVLGLRSALETRREFQSMIVVSKGETVLLRFGGDATSGPIELEVGAKDHLVRRVSFDDGARIYELADYREVAGAFLPFAITERRGEEIVDRVQIDKLEVGGALPGEWFTDGG
jgi:hypothetical protein